MQHYVLKAIFFLSEHNSIARYLEADEEARSSQRIQGDTPVHSLTNEVMVGISRKIKPLSLFKSRKERIKNVIHCVTNTHY